MYVTHHIYVEMEGGSSVPRKGAWWAFEDELLKACIQQYGEGKWHLVPQRAGLNRCRKSCRLRWLNYLRPTIKRGDFKEDEVDLMIRLHKLLGNRWSLIAGRLPGRTANDVKNYWNTSMRRKTLSSDSDHHNKRPKPHHHQVIKPLPRTFPKSTTTYYSSSSNSPSLLYNHNNAPNTTTTAIQEAGSTDSLAGSTDGSSFQVANDNTCSLDKWVLQDLWDKEVEDLLTTSMMTTSPPHNTNNINNIVSGGDFHLEGQTNWSDFLIDDMNFWDF